MKSIYSLAVFCGLALAQNALIGLPKAGQTVAPGDDLIVQVQRPNTASASREVAVVIGIADCTYGCWPASEAVGTILYNGPFDPVYHETYMPPYQNYTITVPSTFPAGNHQLNVAHFYLVGAGPQPYVQALNETIVIS
ncbi:uncharacterized protein N7484_007468 [Penicillium longicatenatum]|uniref:uncharacterized protein n=1 Tax=Penicillium longicatenatum TaxID=1561947 RepID=UPI002547EB10|nr:uncharacterized protein N7484_007468 [Penicillium longicatenatum]KAJ5639606.1 hypothetical protein N7484_007468 [Penicillium longicatenatum]